MRVKYTSRENFTIERFGIAFKLETLLLKQHPKLKTNKLRKTPKEKKLQQALFDSSTSLLNIFYRINIGLFAV